MSVRQPSPLVYTVNGTVYCQFWSYQGLVNDGQTLLMFGM